MTETVKWPFIKKMRYLRSVESIKKINACAALTYLAKLNIRLKEKK